MLTLFDVEIDEKKYPGFKGIKDYLIFAKLKEKMGKADLKFPQVQQYLLEQKKASGGLSASEQASFDKYYKEPLEQSLRQEIETALSKLNEDFLREKEAGKTDNQKTEEKVNEEAGKKPEVEQSAAKKENAERKNEAEKSEAEKKENVEKKDDTKKIDEQKLKKTVETSAKKFSKETKNVQKSLDGFANVGVKRSLTDEDLIRGMTALQRDELSQNEKLQFLRGLQGAKEQNYQNNGAMENNLLQERRDTIKDIGDEYQANRAVTPALMEKKDRLDAIDNVLINVTKYPKLLFISMILMGLNPFLAIGLSVLAAFSKDMVQDIYKNLPKEEKSNLENRPEQQPQQQAQQSADNKQIEEYQQKLAETQQHMKAQELAFQKLAVHNRILNQMMQKLFSQLNNDQVEKERIKAAKEKEKPEAKTEKDDKKTETDKMKVENAQKEAATKQQELQTKRKNSVL